MGHPVLAAALKAAMYAVPLLSSSVVVILLAQVLPAFGPRLLWLGVPQRHSKSTDAFSACESGVTYSVPVGTHAFDLRSRVRAADGTIQSGEKVKQYTWTVTAP